MAYVFDSIDKELGGQQKSDVFGGNTPSAPAQAQSSQGAERTSTTADFTPSAANSAPSSGQARLPRENVNQNVGAAIAESNKATFAGMPTGMRDQATSIGDDMQQHANSYVTKLKEAGAADNLDTATIDSAIGGNADARTKVTGRLTKQAAPVAPYSYGGDTEIKDLNLLNSSSGLQGYMSRNASDTYSSGMAGLDSMLLGQNQDFIRERQDLNNEQQNLRTRAADTAPTTKLGEEAYTKAFDEGTGLITDYLGTKRSELEGKQQKELEDHNKGVRGTWAFPYVNSESAAVIEAVRNKEGGIGGQGSLIDEAVENLKKSGSPYRFYTAPSEATDSNQFYDDEEAAIWNNINGLLGIGGPAVMAGLPVNSTPSYDRAGFEEALRTEMSRIASQREAQRVIKNNADLAAQARLPVPEEEIPGNYTPDFENSGGLAPAGATTGRGETNRLWDISSLFR